MIEYKQYVRCEDVLNVLREDIKQFIPEQQGGDNHKGKIAIGDFVRWYEDKMRKIKSLDVEMTNYDWLVANGNLEEFIKKIHYFQCDKDSFSTLIDIFSPYKGLCFDFHDNVPQKISEWLQAKHPEPVRYIELETAMAFAQNYMSRFISGDIANDSSISKGLANLPYIEIEV